MEADNFRQSRSTVRSAPPVLGGDGLGKAFKITGMVEKPSKGAAPSNYVISGRRIRQLEILDLLST